MAHIDSVEAGKEGDVAPRGAGVQHFLLPVNLATVADGDVLTDFPLGLVGKFVGVDAYVIQEVTTGAKLSTLSLEIGAVAVTGGAVALTSANLATLGAKVAGTAITALNSFGKDDVFSVVAASTTAFIEGEIILDIAYVVLGI